MVPETPPPTQPSIAIFPMSVLPWSVPWKRPATPHADVTTLPVTVEPTCWNVAVAVEPPQVMSSDWKVPLHEPVTFPAGAATLLDGPVTELEF